MYTDVAQEWLKDQPRRTPTQEKFLAQALAFYERFAAERASTPDERYKAALASHRAASIRRALGKYAEAESLSREAIHPPEALTDQFPDRADYRLSLAEAYEAQAVRYEEIGQPREGAAAVRQAIALREGLGERGLASEGGTLEGDYRSLAFALRDPRRGGDGEGGVGPGLSHLRAEAPRIAQAPTRSAWTPPTSWITRAQFLQGDEQVAEAERSWRAPLRSSRRSPPTRRSTVYARELLALVYNNLGALLLGRSVSTRPGRRSRRPTATRSD